MRGIFTLLMVWVLASASPCMAEDDIYLNEDVTSNDGFVIDNDTPPIPRSLLEGTFVLVKTLPEVDLNAKELSQSLFLPGQKVSFKYLYDVSKSYSEWYGQPAYAMTLHPPFHMAMCRQQRWSVHCKNYGTYIPFNNIQSTVMLSTSEIHKDEEDTWMYLLKPLNISVDGYSYFASFADGVGGYSIYFSGNDILINYTYQKKYNSPLKRDYYTAVVQILKRIR